MAEHALEDLDPTFAKEVKKGDILVAGANFGCGSSREQAATCVKASGVAAVVAVSFSRLFFRNAINEGLPVVELASGTETIKKGDTVGIDFEKGLVLHKGKSYPFPALPKEVLAILNDGGLIPAIKKGDTVGIDFEKGVVIHEGREYHFPALPKEVLAILNDGGLIPHVKKALGKA